MHGWRAAHVADVAILARTLPRAEALLEEFGMGGRAYSFDEGQAALADRTVVINASPMGMADQPEMPDVILRPLSSVAAGALAFDMVYAPLDTLFLRHARTGGLATVDGLVMLNGQAAGSEGTRQ